MLKTQIIGKEDVNKGLAREDIEKVGTKQLHGIFFLSKTVGVKGDDRSYDWVIAIRIVNSTDFMTANAARLPVELIELISSEIINKVSNVVLDISNKPPATLSGSRQKIESVHNCLYYFKILSFLQKYWVYSLLFLSSEHTLL